jgi:hypothetical protein
MIADMMDQVINAGNRAIGLYLFGTQDLLKKLVTNATSDK